jgi:hypothetical protein
MHAGTVATMKTQKVTVHLDRTLLRRAQRQTGQGVSATIRQGLELVAARDVYDKLRALRGRVKMALNLDMLRDDRR